jgi:hypothetical protein
MIGSVRSLTGKWGRGKTVVAAVVVVAAGVAGAFGVYRLALDDGEGEPGVETVVECIQGRCIERQVGPDTDAVQSLTAEEQVERLGRQPPAFHEVAREAGVAFRHIRDDDFFNLGGGAAAADFNNDGWLDVYVTNSFGPNALYRSRGDGTFEDVGSTAGVADWQGHGHGAAWGDYDNDGWLDLYVANYGNSRLFRNNGNETFSDITQQAGVGDPAPDYRTTGAAWGDYDKDGYLDLLIVRHIVADGPMFTVTSTAQIVLQRQCRTEEFLADPKVPRGVVLLDPHDFSQTSKRDFTNVVRTLELYRNNGDGTFESVTDLLGDGIFPSNVLGAGFKPSFLDFDNDGDFDIYVVNDFGAENFPNVLWRNDGPDGNGGWRFTDVSADTGADAVMYGMGLAAGDYDNDGDLDINMTDIGASRFFENRAGEFVEVSERTGTGRGLIPENGEVNRQIGWGTVFADFDNDGWLDLYTAAGELDSDPCSNHPNQPNALFINMGDGTFAEVSKASGADDPGTGREVIAGDFNGDGLLDLYVVNMGNLAGEPGIARFYLNAYETSNTWLQVKPLAGDGPAMAIGARVTVTAGNLTHLQYAGLSQGHTSQSVMPVHFGLGQAARVDAVEIEWPSGARQRLEDVEVNQVLEVREPD